MSEELQEALEEISMLIIANSGAARSAAFEALQAAKKEGFCTGGSTDGKRGKEFTDSP